MKKQELSEQEFLDISYDPPWDWMQEPIKTLGWFEFQRHAFNNPEYYGKLKPCVDKPNPLYKKGYK
jgi:hypothetical protein